MTGRKFESLAVWEDAESEVWNLKEALNAAHTQEALNRVDIEASNLAMKLGRRYAPAITRLVSRRQAYITINEPYLKAFGYTG